MLGKPPVAHPSIPRPTILHTCPLAPTYTDKPKHPKSGPKTPPEFISLAMCYNPLPPKAFPSKMGLLHPSRALLAPHTGDPMPPSDTSSLLQALTNLLAMRGCAIEAFLREAILIEVTRPTQPQAALPSPEPYYHPTFVEDAPTRLLGPSTHPVVIHVQHTEQTVSSQVLPGSTSAVTQPLDLISVDHHLVTLQSLFPEINTGEVIDLLNPGQLINTQGPYWVDAAAFGNLEYLIEEFPELVPSPNPYRYSDLTELIPDSAARIAKWRAGGSGVVYQPYSTLVTDAFYESLQSPAKDKKELAFRRKVFAVLPPSAPSKLRPYSDRYSSKPPKKLLPCYDLLAGEEETHKVRIHAATADMPAGIDAAFLKALIGSKPGEERDMFNPMGSTHDSIAIDADFLREAETETEGD